MQSLADKKKHITDEDILALVGDEVHQPEKLWELLDLQVALLSPFCIRQRTGGSHLHLTSAHPISIHTY